MTSEVNEKKKEWGSLYRHHYSKHWILQGLSKSHGNWAISRIPQDYLNMGCECNTLIPEHCSKPTEQNSMKFHHFLSSFLGDSNTNGSQFEEDCIWGEITLAILFAPTLHHDNTLDLINLDVIHCEPTMVRWKEPELELTLTEAQILTTYQLYNLSQVRYPI